ncbi:MAG: transposase [Saprospirales bacterium]|nr:transposase [Saprospirales bacterium]
MNEGTTVAATQMCYDLLQPVEMAIRSQLLSSAANHFDETGLRCAGKRHWLHNCSNNLRKLCRHAGNQLQP